MILPSGSFQNGMAHFKLGQPVLKLTTDFKSGCNIYTYEQTSPKAHCLSLDTGVLKIAFTYI